MASYRMLLNFVSYTGNKNIVKFTYRVETGKIEC